MNDTTLIFVLFAYGLVLFAMGLAITLEIRRDRALALARALPWLAAFGLVHSVVEWLDMFQVMRRNGLGFHGDDLFSPLNLLVLVASGVLLTQFGASLLATSLPKVRWVRWLPVALLLLWFGLWLASVGLRLDDDWVKLGTISARYVFYFPGAVVSSLALLSQRSAFRAMGLPRIAHACTWGAAAFCLKAIVGGLVVPRAMFFPASTLNYASFLAATGVPSGILRALAAMGITYFVLRVLRLFERRRQEELEHITHQLKRLSVQALSAQEEERKRIARDLHDDTAQLLSTLLLRLKLLERTKTLDEMKAKTKQVVELATKATEGVRRTAFELRPAALEDLGLPAAIRWYSEELAAPRGLTVEVNSVGLRDRLPDEVELALYRVVQEGLTNVAKHSGARRADVTMLQVDGSVRVCVQDDGCGFDVKEVTSSRDRGLGIFGMQERVSLLGGSLQIDSRPRSGTCITIEVPITDRGETRR